MEIIEKINPKCLHVDNDRVFVSYTDGVIRTASKEFYRRWKESSFAARLVEPLSFIPKSGSRLRITNWHYAVPVKIELKVEGHWKTIYEVQEVPRGLRCLVEDHKENPKCR